MISVHLSKFLIGDNLMALAKDFMIRYLKNTFAYF